MKNLSVRYQKLASQFEAKASEFQAKADAAADERMAAEWDDLAWRYMRLAGQVEHNDQSPRSRG